MFLFLCSNKTITINMSVSVCCICLKKYSHLDGIYEEDKNKVKYCDKLKTCLPSEVWYKVYKICKNCIEHLESAYQFILTCLRNKYNRRDTYEIDQSPYSCNDCKKTFKLESRLKKHINDYHPFIQPLEARNGRCKNEEISSFEENPQGIINNLKDEQTENELIDLKIENDLKFLEKEEVDEDIGIENNEDEYKAEDSDQNLNDLFKSDFSNTSEEFKTVPPKKRRKVLKKKRTPKLGSKSHVKETFNCEYCSEIFRTAKYLRKHTITKHTFERPYKCDQCDATYRGKDMLVIHKRKHTGETPFVCFVCGKAFKSSHGLFVHNQTHAKENRYGCPNCEKGFKTLGNLRKHLICVHTKSEDYKYECQQCGHKFPFKGHLEKHLIRHTGIKNCPCRICGKMFILKTDAELHIRRTHKNDQLSCCEVCYKEFKSTEGLQKHLKTAHNIGNYKVQVHVKKLLCPYCPKMFPYNNKLQRHILTHTGEKPFKCNICTKGFRDKTDLKTHLKNSHQFTDIM